MCSIDSSAVIEHMFARGSDGRATNTPAKCNNFATVGEGPGRSGVRIAGPAHRVQRAGSLTESNGSHRVGDRGGVERSRPHTDPSYNRPNASSAASSWRRAWADRP